MIRLGILKTITLLLIINCCAMISACENAKELQMEKYIETTDSRLIKIEHEILALRERADNWGTPDKAEFEAQLDKLSEKESLARQKLKELQGSDAGNWLEAKTEMDSLMQAVEKAYQDTRDW